jgi:hypothetical protein
VLGDTEDEGDIEALEEADGEREDEGEIEDD